MEKNKIKTGEIAKMITKVEPEAIVRHHNDDILMPGISMFGKERDKFSNTDVMLLEPYIGFGVLDLPKKTTEAKRNE